MGFGFLSCLVIVALHGAVLINLVLCRPGTRVLEVHSPHHQTGAFACAAYVTGCRYDVLPWLLGPNAAEEEGMRATWRHFSLDLDALEAALETLVKE